MLVSIHSDVPAEPGSLGSQSVIMSTARSRKGEDDRLGPCLARAWTIGMHSS